MGTLGIISLVLGILGLAAGAGVSVAQSQSNERAISETNSANAQAIRETNASNVEQAELAYRRSLPINQVNNLMAAGMSKSAAIQSLSGGGTYQAPVLQSAHADAPQVDYSGIASAMERLGNIPSNAEQFRMQQLQRRNLEQEYQLRQNEEIRKQDIHDFDIWSKRYGKRTAELLDGVSSKVVQIAADKNYDLSQAKSVQQIMRDLGLESDRDYQNLPHLARLQLHDAIRTANDQRISLESHSANMREQEDKHTLSVLEQQKVQDAISQGRAHFEEWQNESDIRSKERRLRSLADDLSILRNEIGLAEEDANAFMIYLRDNEGNLKKDEIAKQLGKSVQLIDAFWQGFFKIIPFNALSKSLLGDLIKIGI